MTIIELNKKLYTVPENWNELSRSQLMDMIDCLFIKEHTTAEVVLKMLKILMGMSWWQFYKVDMEEMSEYIYLVEAFLKKKIEFTKQILPQFNGQFGPSDAFSNLVMEELVFTESYYEQWAENREDEKALNELIAVLYRKPKRGYDFDKNPDGDARIPFNENICSHNAANVICHWGMVTKLAIATWYEGCRTKMVEDNAEVFSPGGEKPKYGLISIIRAIAKNGVLGDFNSVEKKYVNLVMIELNESIAEAKEIEKLSKQ